MAKSNQEDHKIRVIRPDNRVGEGIIAGLLHLMMEIWRFRTHIRIVFKEQFRAAYAGTGLGIFWNYTLPLIPLTVYWFLSRLRVIPNFEGVDSATFLIFGITLWFLFTGCVQIPIQVIRSCNKESMKTAFPLSASIVAGFAKLLFDTLVRVTFVASVMVYSESWPMWQALLLPLVFAPAIILFIGAGLVLGIFNIIYNDVSRVVNILLQYGIFVSGVIFPLYEVGLLSQLNLYNPFAVFIEASRSIVFQGGIENLNVYLGMTGSAIFIFLIACRVFFIMENRIRGIN